MTNIGVLVSGRGSNLQAIIDEVAAGTLSANIAIVISNRADAAGLDRARKAHIATLVLEHTDRSAFPTREDYDRRLVRELKDRGVELVCLAGFMRRLSPAFIEVFQNAILNIHPSLLPSFPGMDAARQAWAHGVKVTGATVHLVTAGLDDGPIVAQEAVPVLDTDTAETLGARILEKENDLYPRAIRLVLDRAWRLDGRRLIPS